MHLDGNNCDFQTYCTLIVPTGGTGTKITKLFCSDTNKYGKPYKYTVL